MTGAELPQVLVLIKPLDNREKIFDVREVQETIHFAEFCLRLHKFISHFTDIRNSKY